MKIQKKNLSLHLIKFDNYVPIFYLMLLSVFQLSIFGKIGKDKDKMIKLALMSLDLGGGKNPSWDWRVVKTQEKLPFKSSGLCEKAMTQSQRLRGCGDKKKVWGNEVPWNLCKWSSKFILQWTNMVWMGVKEA